MIKAVIFDCFGVIITDALDGLVRRLERERPGIRESIMDIVHANNLGLLNPRESNEQIGKIIGVSAQEYRQMIDAAEAKDHEVLDWILQLKQTYKTALLSNIGRASLERRFSSAELQAHFDAVIASGDLGIAKPDPVIYRHTAEQLAVEPAECVFLDDREGHCSGAREAGMHAICFQNLRQAQADLQTILAKPAG